MLIWFPTNRSRDPRSGGKGSISIPGQLELAAQQSREQLTWEGLLEAGYVISGPPDKVISQLTHLADTLNVGHLMLPLQLGNMPRDVTYYNTRMFAEQVAPHLRSKFSEWEDKWYPKMMPMDDRAVPQTPNGVADITAADRSTG